MEAAALGHVVCLDLLLEVHILNGVVQLLLIDCFSSIKKSRVDVNAANNQGVSALHEVRARNA